MNWQFTLYLQYKLPDPNVFLAISPDLYYIVYIEKIVENMYALACATVKIRLFDL